jgi:hypothetical protein
MRGCSMRNAALTYAVALVAVLILWSSANAQSNKPAASGPKCGPAQPGTIYQKACSDPNPPGPAPKRDLNGAWAGPTDWDIHNVPPMTPMGEERFKQNKPEGKFSLSETNDPLSTCDPLGFPRNILNEVRGMMFVQLPDRMLVLYQYQRVWREMWMDGRELPKDIDTRDGTSSDYYGYSVAHWDGDYTFMVDTVGLDDRTWLDKGAHPHSDNMHVKERYTRVDQKTLQETVTIDDPATYTKPFEELSSVIYKWNPTKALDEQLCVPSDGIAYMNTIGRPAGDGSTAK